MLKPTLIGSAARAVPAAKEKNESDNMSAIDATHRASGVLNILSSPLFAS
jgi:hypothetical protein